MLLFREFHPRVSSLPIPHHPVGWPQPLLCFINYFLFCHSSQIYASTPDASSHWNVPQALCVQYFQSKLITSTDPKPHPQWPLIKQFSLFLLELLVPIVELFWIATTPSDSLWHWPCSQIIHIPYTSAWNSRWLPIVLSLRCKFLPTPFMTYLFQHTMFSPLGLQTCFFLSQKHSCLHLSVQIQTIFVKWTGGWKNILGVSITLILESLFLWLESHKAFNIVRSMQFFLHCQSPKSLCFQCNLRCLFETTCGVFISYPSYFLGLNPNFYIPSSALQHK